MTVAAVASEAGVSVKTLFQYFRSKEDLLFGDEDQMRDRLVAAIAGRPRGSTPLRAATDWLLAELEHEPDPESLERYHRMVGDSPAVAARLLGMWEHYERAVARVLADEANEAVPSPHTQLVAAQMVAMVRVVTSPEVREFVPATPPPISAPRWRSGSVRPARSPAPVWGRIRRPDRAERAGASLPSPGVRAPVDHIAAPPFPPRLPWINVAPMRMDQQVGHPVLIEFWDFCRVNSIRTIPYMRAWYERYRNAGLRMIGVHAAGFEPSADPDAVRDAVARLEVPYPVVVDVQLEIWEEYGNLGWPARYLFDGRSRLFEYHYGEGAYDETERAIQELLAIDEPLLEPIRPEEVPEAQLVVQTDDVEGPYSGPYEAGGVWAVLDGEGFVVANGRRLRVDHPGCYELISHPRSTSAELELEVGPGVTCHAVCFTPGLA